jgi:PelA/Pel-15E family pectate lyase
MIKPVLFFALLLLNLASASAQDTAQSKTPEYYKLSWKAVATQMPEQWYASADAVRVAETVLFCQQEIGGWAKNKPYHHPLSEPEKTAVIKSRSEIGATIDNGATITEMAFLAKVYSQHKDDRYRKAFEKAFNYLLEAQYANGGWPQFFPFRKGNAVSYASHITYNDNAMVNVLQLLSDIAENKSLYASLPFTAAMREKAKKAFDKGIDCIVKTQIKVDGKPTVWCAQHDEVTLKPANARAYELASFSGQESVGIVQLLMSIKNPGKEVIASIKGAIKWLDEHKITGIKVENRPEANGKRNRVVVEDKNAPVLLARFYDLETGKPFFCDRDGIKKSSLAEIGAERRNGYSWYGTGFENLQMKYNNWLKNGHNI